MPVAWREGETIPPNEAVLGRLFDSTRDREERVKADDWHQALVELGSL